MRSSLCSLAVAGLLLSACQSNSPMKETSAAAEYAAAADSTNFSNDPAPLNSPSRKRVKTADVRCRVNNVFSAVSALEYAVRAMDGVIVESVMQNELGAVQDIPYSADSLKRVQLYTPTANLTLRVPVAGLDSIVHTLTSMAAFIDRRTLKEDDRTLAYLSNALKNKAVAPAAIKPDKNSTPLDVAMYRDEKKENAVDRRIANLAILDDVNYATLSVQLFQPQLADVQVVVNPDNIIRAGFGTELLAALHGGVVFFRDTLLFFVRLWPFVLLAGAVWFMFRKLSGKGMAA